MDIPIKVIINDIECEVRGERLVDILDMHIEALADLTKQNLKSRMALRNYVEVKVIHDDAVWGYCIWVPPGVVHIETTDGSSRDLQFDVFTQIIEVNPGIDGLELEPISPLSPMNTDMLQDINNPQHLGFDIIAQPVVTTESFDWGFNGGNGILAFKELYTSHKKWDKDMRHIRVVLYHNHYMGYHFDPATRETILKYYKPKSRKG